MRYDTANKYKDLILAMMAGQIIQANRGTRERPKWVTLQDEVQFTCEPDLYRAISAEQAKRAEVEAAYARGERIEFRVRGQRQWLHASNPHWNWDKREYRVSPAPRRLWRIEIGDGESQLSHWGAYRSRKAAEDALPEALRRQAGYELIEYVQVMR